MPRYLLALACTAAILAASSDLFSSVHTGGWLRYVLGNAASSGVIDALNAVLRKGGHVAAYGLHAFLWMRALRPGGSWRRAAVGAVAITFAVAVTDELHQSFLPSRGGSPFDVLLDSCGGALAVLLFRR